MGPDVAMSNALELEDAAAEPPAVIRVGIISICGCGTLDVSGWSCSRGAAHARPGRVTHPLPLPCPPSTQHSLPHQHIPSLPATAAGHAQRCSTAAL